MGLLEKALEYKKAMNRRGEVTLIDTIQGPAETEMMEEMDQIEALTKREIISDNNTAGNTDEGVQWPDDDESINDGFFDLPEDDDFSPLDSLQKQKNITDNGFISTDENAEITALKNTEPYIPDEIKMFNPLTSEDDPILPKDIDAEIKHAAIIKSTSQDQNEISFEESETDSFTRTDNADLEMFDPLEDNSTLSDVNDITIESPDDALADVIESASDAVMVDAKEPEDLDTGTGGGAQKHRILFEISKEITKSETKKALFEVVVFSVMGQIVTSFAAIMIKDPENNKWVIAHSNVMRSADKNYSFDVSSVILKNVKKDIIDIEKYKDDPGCSQDYTNLSSIGVRLLAPWFHKGKVLGILALGKKITDDDYFSEELDFIEAVCESSAIELNKINTIEKIKTESESSKTSLDFLNDINNIHEKIISNNNLKTSKEIIGYECDKIGILKYAIFLFDVMKDKYIPVVVNGKDQYPMIDEDDKFISFIKNRAESARINDFSTLEAVREVFGESEIKKYSILWIYPFFLGTQLAGFTSIFSIKDELLDEAEKTAVDMKLGIFSKMILSDLINIKSTDPDENKYTDNIEIILKKIESELLNSKNMKIPLSLVIISVKNYKRYGNVFGYKKAKELIDNFSGLIKSRLSDTDFSARYDRNKIIIVLPGKDKKFASALSNAVRNEFMLSFKKSEMQLLITFLVSGYPEDGDDLMSLMDVID